MPDNSEILPRLTRYVQDQSPQYQAGWREGVQHGWERAGQAAFGLGISAGFWFLPLCLGCRWVIRWVGWTGNTPRPLDYDLLVGVLVASALTGTFGLVAHSWMAKH